MGLTEIDCKLENIGADASYSPHSTSVNSLDTSDESDHFYEGKDDRSKSSINLSNQTATQSALDLSALNNPSSSDVTLPRRRSVNELRASTLFLDSAGSDENRLSVLFKDPKSFKNKRRSFLTGPRNQKNNRLSLTLTREDSMLAIYRENAKKTNDPQVQMEFAKFLLTSPEEPENIVLSEEKKKSFIEEALFWVKRLRKANYPEAIYITGVWYENGLYEFPLSTSKADSYFLTAAKLGYAPALDKVAHRYEKKKDITRAVAYYNKAASLGNASANYRLGIAHVYGELKFPRNNQYGIFYLRRAAASATTEFPQAAYIWALVVLGIYEHDLGILDQGEGQEYLDKAAELGYVPAMHKLGHCYEFGDHGFSIDPELSIEFYRKAAEEGHSESQMALSGWYLTGAPGCLNQIDESAYHWCEKAIDSELPKAEYAMGYYHEVGVGVPVDLEKARYWYEKAALHGSEDAKKRLEKSFNEPKLRKSEYGSIKLKKHAKSKTKKSDCVIS